MKKKILKMQPPPPKMEPMGSGCGSVGRVVVSDIRDPWFESSHRQIVITINFIEETEIKKREAGNYPN